MTAEMNKLLAKCILFKNSLEQDLKNYEKQYDNGGFSSESLIEDWKNTLENLKKVDILRQKIINLETSASNICTQTMDLQKSPYARSRINTPLEDVHQKLLENFGELRKRSSDERRIPRDNAEVVRLLCLCLQYSHTHTQDVVSHIKTVKQIKQDIDNCLPQISNLLKEISDWDLQIDTWQAKRQQALWKVIDVLLEKAHNAERSISPLELSTSPVPTFPRRTLGTSSLSRTNTDSGAKHFLESPRSSVLMKTPPIITPPAWHNKLESLALSSSFSNGERSLSRMKFNPTSMSSMVTLTDMLDKTTEESRKVKKENETILESFQDLMGVLKSFQGENLDKDKT
ncbi:i-kappa-B kinase [Caerostris extrusa]|uniref:I-kappa-B kinase n=1 Tax=Caerostris extrusa TaxID=172846 RepID=A0AAV4QL90_CAEEX|nr:i-kappa-B kinase [Caerostris extrusa]